MINFSDITQAIETLLTDNLTGYDITRNDERNEDYNRPANAVAWVGIYRGSVDYESYAVGSVPWLASVDTVVEIQVASMISGADAENKLQDAEEEVMDILTANKKLSDTVNMTNGYSVEYEYNADTDIGVWLQASIITIHSEVRQ